MLKNKCLVLTVMPVFLLGFYLSAQVLQVSPIFPSAEDTVTIIYDASMGNAGLKDFNQQVYLHTGLITDKSQSPSDWKYVVGSWGTTDSRLIMTSLGKNLYSVKFHIRSFYNVPVNEKVLKLAFVFRNSTGSLSGREANGGDIFYNLADPEGKFQALWLNPTGRYKFLSPSENVTFSLACSKSADIKLYVNGILERDLTGKELVYDFATVADGNYKIVAKCSSGSELVELEYNLVVGEPQTIVQNPPPGIAPGLNYVDNHSVYLMLTAPLKKHVFVLGNWNNYSPVSSALMKKSESGDIFWILIDQLDSNFNYNYQYLIDGKLIIADPLSTQVLDPANDAKIPLIVYPDIPEYPINRASGYVTSFSIPKSKFQWTSSNFIPVPPDQMMIYELLIRDFAEERSFNSVLNKIPYLKNLGINALELMPVNEFEGNDSWGYNPSFHAALDKYYGTQEQLKKLIDVCHENGIAVVLDVVFNHAFSQCPLVQMYWDAASNRPAANSPYFNMVARHPFNVGYDFNHESKYTRAYVKQVLEHWLKEYHVDGFRFDLSKGFTQFNSGSDASLMSRYDAIRIAILKDYGNLVKSLKPNAYVILEHFADNAEEKELSESGFLLWGNMNYNFNQASMGYGSNDLNSSLAVKRGWSKNHLISYMESHDEERLNFKNLQYGNGTGNYNIKQLNTAIERQKLVHLFYLLMPGPKMIWQNGEVGYDYSINHCIDGTINTNCRLAPKPIRADYFDHPSRKSLYDFIAKVNAFKNQSGLVQKAVFESSLGEGLIKWMKFISTDLNAFVVGNFDIVARNPEVQFPHTGRWYNVLDGTSLLINDPKYILSLVPGDHRLYVDQSGWNTVGTHESWDARDLIRIYPNPTSGNVHFESYEEFDRVDIYNLDGIQVLSEKFSPVKTIELNIDPQIAQGIYFCRIFSLGKMIATSKLTIY
ncbi:MAG: DUF4961 domain-containing protein [Saprospiraceae bacterium]|nr:DUF4961 domain-containing protein [Candidatus Vicinibacter affinis]